MARSRLKRRYSKNPAQPRSNPPLMTDLAEFVIPGFGGFAATKFASYVAATQIAKRKPSLGKHGGAAVAVGLFLASWFLANRAKFLAKYHTPIVVGSAIATIQSLVQLYIPKLGWMLADPTPEIAAASDAAVSATAHLELTPTDEDPNEFVYNDSYDAGRYAKGGGNGKQTPGIMSPGAAKDSADDLSDLDISDAIGQSGNLGVFSN